MVIALSVSHIRAEAEAAGVSLSEGFFQRLERYVAMMIGLPFPGALLPALAMLTVLGGVTLAAAGMDGPRPRARRPATPGAPHRRADAGRWPERRIGRPTWTNGYRRIASLAEVPEGELRAYDLAGARIAIVHVEQELFAIADECPHDRCSLAEGDARRRRGHRDLSRATGASSTCGPASPLDGPAVDPLPVFAVRERDGWIEIAPATEGGG